MSSAEVHQAPVAVLEMPHPGDELDRSHLISLEGRCMELTDLPGIQVVVAHRYLAHLHEAGLHDVRGNCLSAGAALL